MVYFIHAIQSTHMEYVENVIIVLLLPSTGKPLDVVSLNQVEKDTVMVGYDHILFGSCDPSCEYGDHVILR